VQVTDESEDGIVRRQATPEEIAEFNAWRAPYVCLSPTPSIAWQLCGQVVGQVGQTWDLWMVQLAAVDNVHVLPMWGTEVQEVRVHGRVPKSRVWWVGERTITQTRGRNR
jgi:hypothetical protein